MQPNISTDNAAELSALGVTHSTVANDVLTLLKSSTGTAIANHCLRTYLFARLYAENRGVKPGHDYDPDVLFYACALHDIGIIREADSDARFEVGGADFAARLLSGHSVAHVDVDSVWEAIAFHTSGGIAERRGPICEMTRYGVVIDFGRGTEFISDETAAEIHQRYPRLDVAAALVDAVVAQVGGQPMKAPPFSMPAEFVRARASGPTSPFEEQIKSIRWSVYA